MSEDIVLEIDRLVSIIEQSTKTLYAILSGLERFKNNGRFKKSIRKTHCSRGHERTPESVYKSGNCKICSALAKQREGP